MMRSILNWGTSSLLLSLLIGCQSVQRPDADLCGVNAPGMTLQCLNIKTDFNDDGTRVSGSKLHAKPIAGLSSLNAGIYMSPSDFEKVKVWIADLRNAYAQLQQQCSGK